MTHQQPSTPTPFDHRMAVFDSDDDFLAAALPFLGEGLAAPGEPPPVAIADPRNLDLLRDALGGDAKDVTCVPHTDWYTGSAANAVARAAAYLAANAGPGGRIHLLMEPVWSGRAGRSARETTEWIRYEALANLLFAPMATTALCAYDTRTAGPAVVAAARRAHPDTDVYEEPVRLVAELDAVPLPLPPAGAQPLAQPHATAVQTWAETRGLPAADAELFATAVAETAAALGSPRRHRTAVGRGARLRLRTALGPPRRRPARRLRPATGLRLGNRTGAVVRAPGVRVRRHPRRRRGSHGPPPVRLTPHPGGVPRSPPAQAGRGSGSPPPARDRPRGSLWTHAATLRGATSRTPIARYGPYPPTTPGSGSPERRVRTPALRRPRGTRGGPQAVGRLGARGAG